VRQFEPLPARVKGLEQGPHEKLSAPCVCLRRGLGASIADVSEDKDPDFVESLEKGFRVIRAFDVAHSRMALSEVAARTQLTRASARRFLRTLVKLGYATFDGKRFALTARVLELGFAYLASDSLLETLTPYLARVNDQLRESCSASVLEGLDIVYVARVSTSRIMSVSLGVGARLPAIATSMGRVLLAALPRRERDERIARAELIAHTRHTVTRRSELRTILKNVATEGYCIVDQELEEGLRSIAVPVVDQAEQVRAAINASAQANRISLDTMRRTFLPALQRAATDLRSILRGQQTLEGDAHGTPLPRGRR
jgi:IclR family pca regulon transcriptional regulator